MNNSDQPPESRLNPVFENSFIKRWMYTAVAFFLLAAVFGTLMRLFFVVEIPFLNYKHIMHAHSHTALLGWGYMFVSGALIFLLLNHSRKPRVYHYLYLINIIAAVAMAVSFTYQGYGTLSISFSTLHIISVYVFAFYFLKDLSLQSSPPNPFIKWSVIWLLVSTLGLWAIAPVSAFLGKLHPLYYASIQFFLHFQFNGWFTFAILGLLYQYTKRHNTQIKVPVSGFWILQLSLLLTYALSITWSTPLSLLFYLNSLGVILQAVAFYFILKPLFRKKSIFGNSLYWTDWLLLFGIACIIFKVLIQTTVAIPLIAEISYIIRNYVIGFIHLIMLGSVTLSGVALLLKYGLLPANKLSKTGWILLGFGFISTEIILFGQGTLLWMRLGFISNYHEIIFAFTTILPLSLGIILFGLVKDSS